MGIVALTGIAVALAMDAFAVAVVAGLTLRTITKRHVFRLSFHFGLFQSLMFAIGWLFGTAVHSVIEAVDHWIACALLTFVAINMLRGSSGGEAESNSQPDPTSGWMLVTLSIATSIDALAVGFSLAMVNIALFTAAAIIGITAAAFVIVGMLMGRSIGRVWGRTVEVLGGVVLIAIGLRILWTHLLAR